MLTCDRYHTPKSLDEAFHSIEVASGRYRFVLGCTDIIPWARPARAEDVHIPDIIDLSRVSELNGIELKGTRIRLGAGTTFQQFIEDKALRDSLPVMPRCASWFADEQIRRQATIAGNLVNASPAADGNPPLFTLDASIVLASKPNDAVQTRTVPVSEFVVGPAETTLLEDEIVVAVECESFKGYGGAFSKVGHRRSLVISVACVATLVKPNADGTAFEDVRMAFGGVGPAPVRVPEVEAHLSGKPISTDVIREAAELPVDRIRSRSRQQYRREVVREFVFESIVDALDDVGITV